MATSKRISIMGLIALFLLNFGYMADMVIVPAADSIIREFANAPVGVLNFILSGPQLFAIGSALLVSALMRSISKKNIIVALFSLFTVAACLGAAIKDPYYIAIMRALVGISYGGMVPVAIALINEIYHEDEKKCSALVGTFNGFTALIGAVMAIVAGWLCAIHWSYVFYEYLAAIPILILLIVFVPKTKPEKVQTKEDGKAAVSEKVPIGRVIALLGSVLVVCIIFNFMVYQSSIYVAQNGLGDSVFSGILNSVITILTAIACFIFSFVYGRFKRGTAALMYFVLAAGYFGCSFALNQIWAIFCVALLGFGFGLAMSYFFIYATVIVPPTKVSMMLGLVAADIGLGTFLCTYASTFLMSFFSFTKLTSVCLIYAGVAVVGGVVSVILTLRNSRKLHLDEPNQKDQNEVL
jgi:MFS family permease